MFELRWYDNGEERTLQYRTVEDCYTDASGALNVMHSKWGEWRDVPVHDIRDGNYPNGR